MHKIFELAKYISPPISNNEEYQEDVWDTKDMNYKDEIIRKSIKEGLPEAIQEEDDDRNIYFCRIPPEN